MGKGWEEREFGTLFQFASSLFFFGNESEGFFEVFSTFLKLFSGVLVVRYY
jgi:hypothetical protein